MRRSVSFLEVSIEALFDRVYENPDDRGARLVLGDALLETGDPRGEYISLQHARGGKGKPSERERELFNEHHIEWLGNLAPAASAPRHETHFDLGFVSRLTYTNGRGAVCTGMREWSTVRRIDLHWNRDTCLPMLCSDVVRRHARTLDGMIAGDFVEVAANKEPFDWNEINVICRDQEDRIANAFEIYAGALPRIRSIGFQNSRISAAQLERIVETRLFTQLNNLFLHAPSPPWSPELLGVIRRASRQTQFHLSSRSGRLWLSPSGEMTLSAVNQSWYRDELIELMDDLLDARVRVVKVRCMKDHVEYFATEIQKRKRTMELLATE